MTDIRVSQEPVEVLCLPTPALRLSQLAVEVLYPNTPATSYIRVTQVVAESAQQYSAVPVRVSGVGLESAQQYSAVPVRVSGVNLESMQQYSAVPVRVSQVGLEVMYTDDGQCYMPVEPTPPTVTTYPIRRLRLAPHVHQSMDWLYYELLEIDLETGVGLNTTGSGADPQLMLRWSDDGGHTWSNEHWVSVGKIGAYQTRAIWRRLGRSRDRVFEVSMSDPVKWVLIGARLDLKKGTN